MLLTVLVAFTIVRVFQPGNTQLGVAVAAITPWPYFLAWPVAIVSLVRRRWLTVAVSASLIAAQVLLVLPTWWPGEPAAPVGPWRLRIIDANVRNNNLELGGIAREIEADRPDVVTLQELSDENVRSLLRTGAVADYRWHVIHLSSGSTGFGVWSDVPLADPTVWYADSHAEFSAMLRPPAGPSISLLAIHTFAPRGSGEPTIWSRELQEIAARAAADAKPLIVVGDLKQFQALLDQHLHDAAVELGQGWRMTWTRNVRFIPPFLRPDHLLYSDGLTATSYRLGQGSGSDHKPLLVELAGAS